MHPARHTLTRMQRGRRRYAKLSKAEWTADVDGFKDRTHALLCGGLHKDPQHPLYNFIFKYYFSMSPKCLTHYSPGMNVLLLDTDEPDSGASLAQSSWGDPYRPVSRGYVWDPAELAVPATKRRAMSHVLQLLQSIDKKPPSLRCYGLHEWAMVYIDGASRETAAAPSPKLSKFQSLPLRVTSESIRSVLQPDPAAPPLLRCTHYDAFRFFTDDGRVLNTVNSPVPARYVFSCPICRGLILGVRCRREHILQLEQPGCIHVQMDLFKWDFSLTCGISSCSNIIMKWV